MYRCIELVLRFYLLHKNNHSLAFMVYAVSFKDIKTVSIVKQSRYTPIVDCERRILISDREVQGTILH